MQASDYHRTLSPEGGIARRVVVVPPRGTDQPLWSVAVDIGASDVVPAHQTLDITWVGAAGTRRADTITRAAGESVERAALLRPSPPCVDGVAWAPRGRCWHAAAERGPGVAGAFVDAGVRTAVRVPTAATLYPLQRAEGVDPSPSGTAAGVDRVSAVASACKELVERDAAMRAWHDPERAHLLPEVRWTGEGRRLVELLADVGCRVDVLGLPGAGGSTALMVVAQDHRLGTVAVGMGLELNPWRGAHRALQEAVQVRAILLSLAVAQDESPIPVPVPDEWTRARFWAGPEAVPAVADWLAAVGRAPAGPQAISAPWTTVVGPRTEVDLTGNLPQPLRDMGWAVVKVFSPTLQPLTMDDTLGWNLPAPWPMRAAPHPLI